MKRYFLPILAAVLATTVTATMDFTGLTMFSAFPLIAITLIFWLIHRLSREEFGLTFGKLKDYGIALLYPLVVLGTASLIAYLAGEVAIKEEDHRNELINLAAGIVIGPLMVLLTEEGFFRGWLWGAFKKAGMSPKNTLFVTTAAFVVWHISAVTAESDYGLPAAQVPIYLVNVALLGLIWGKMRLISGSAIVPAVSHAVWNAFAYGLFGYGEVEGIWALRIPYGWGLKSEFWGLC